MNLSIITYNTHGLPWSRIRYKEICAWLCKQEFIDIICLQEVFTKKAINHYVNTLRYYGFVACIPDDNNCTILSSGLLTFYNQKHICISSVFCSYQNYHNVEWFANKGFHVVRLKTKKNFFFNIVNTHTQSNTEVSFFFGTKIIDVIRKTQFQQIYDFFVGSKVPVLIVGDLNCNISPNSNFRFLSFIHNNLFHKSTFFSTGEDLDHVAWIPSQYAPLGCHMCDIELYGPKLKNCIIHNNIHFSDHAPVHYDIHIPSRCTTLESYS
jgi:exonuclease III